MDRNVQVYEFLLFSVFGKNAGPIDAAINRAYRDMAAHTMVFKKECDMNDGEKKEYKAEKKKMHV